MNEKLLKYQKLYLLALRHSLAKTGDKVFNHGNEYKHIRLIISRFNNPYRYKLKPCRGWQNGGWDFATAGTEWVRGIKMAAESLISPCPPETDGVSGCACGTINNNLARVRAQSHFEEMGRGKRAGRWRAVVWAHLHIDDGSMGGGGPIPHVDFVHYNTQPGDNNDLWDYRNNYFTNNRDGIFHYCLFAHQKSDGSTTTGWGAYLSDTFIIYDGAPAMNDWKDQRKAFLHELGHNILGAYCDVNDPVFLPRYHNPSLTHFLDGPVSDDSDLDGDGTDDVYSHNDNSKCAMVKGHYDDPPSTYDSDTWNAINLKDSI